VALIEHWRIQSGTVRGLVKSAGEAFSRAVEDTYSTGTTAEEALPARARTDTMAGTSMAISDHNVGEGQKGAGENRKCLGSEKLTGL